ncbi:hypothetical protein D9M68_928910 [compost metagenome]
MQSWQSSCVGIFRAVRRLHAEVILQPRLLAGRHEQAELGASPKNIGSFRGPFLLAQVIHFPRVQTAAQVFAEVA